MPSSPDAVNAVTTVTAWQTIGTWLSDNIVNIISAIFAGLSALYAFQANKNAAESQRRADEASQETDRLQAELHRIRDYFDASEQYGKVNERIIDFNSEAFAVICNRTKRAKKR